MLSPASGLLTFARYAYPPNRLGYCGPDAADELLGEAGAGLDARALRALAEQFEGAYPYLELIARANNIADPLDSRVVDAYWLGSNLLTAVKPRDMDDELRQRFRPRLRSKDWRWLAGKPAAGAVPLHAFHVLDVLPRIGLLRSGPVDRVVETVDACRIRWGRVVRRTGDVVTVSAPSLELVGGQLRLSASHMEDLIAGTGGHSAVDRFADGDVVSIHWGWACERLDAQRLGSLRGWTARQLALANQTI